MSSRILSHPGFCIWAIINLAAGIWEVYAYLNRARLKLEFETVWEKMSKKQITLSNFWLEGWSEYCKVDSRYTREFSSGGYVWYFELLNAFLAVLFIFALAFGFINIIKIILLIGIINCLGYFATLALEMWGCQAKTLFLAQGSGCECIPCRQAKTLFLAQGSGCIRIPCRLDNRFSRWWQYPIYYLISGIWLLVPWCLYEMVSRG